MAERSNPDPAVAAAMAGLHPQLLALHAAIELGALWEATRDLLRAAVPCARVTLFLGHLAMKDARVVYSDPPIENWREWYEQRGLINPFTAYIRSHRKLRSYRFSDVLGPREEFVKTEFYERFAKPEGWDKGFSVLFWAGTEVKAMFSVYRAPRRADFTAAEIALLEQLAPFIEVAIDRVEALHNERQMRRGLEEFNRRIPIAILLLDWELRPLFANREAQRRSAEWILGKQGARQINSGQFSHVPEEVLEACRRMKEAMVQGTKIVLAKAPPQRLVECATVEGLQAVVSLAPQPLQSIARPRFLVLFEEQATARSVTGMDRLDLLRRLTPSERELAERVCQGCSNQEIASELNKSILTVKAQLTAVYRRLGVPNRTRLIALLR